MVQQVTFYNWIASYICSGPDCPNGYEMTLDQSKSIWQFQNLLTNPCAIPFVSVTGKVADKLSAKIMIPGALIF